MFDLSMFQTGTRGTPAHVAGVPVKRASIPRNNSYLRKVEHMEHAEHQKNTNTGTGSGTPDREEWRESFEERAAIMEYSGGLPRHEAEHQARIICLAEFRNRKR